MKARCPYQAATQFEQKIVDWIFCPLFAIRLRRPPRLLGPKTEVRLLQMCNLILFIMSAYIFFHLWNNLIPDILFVINSPDDVVYHQTITRPRYAEWAILIFYIFTTGFTFILLRIKNWPLDTRLAFFFPIGWGLALTDPIRFFMISAPASVWLGEIILAVVLVGVGAFSSLICVIRAKKLHEWFKEVRQSWELLREESGEAGKTDPQ